MDRSVDFVAPLEITFPLDDADFTVRPANVRQIGQMLRVASPLVDRLVAMDAGVITRAQSAEGPTADDVVALFTLLCDHGDAPVALVSAATGIEQAVLEEMLPDRFAYLFALVVQVNADFFGRAVPTFMQAGTAMSAAMRAAQQPLPNTTARSHLPSSSTA